MTSRTIRDFEHSPAERLFDGVSLGHRGDEEPVASALSTSRKTLERETVFTGCTGAR